MSSERKFIEGARRATMSARNTSTGTNFSTNPFSDAAAADAKLRLFIALLRNWFAIRKAILSLFFFFDSLYVFVTEDFGAACWERILYFAEC